MAKVDDQASTVDDVELPDSDEILNDMKADEQSRAEAEKTPKVEEKPVVKSTEEESTEEKKTDESKDDEKKETDEETEEKKEPESKEDEETEEKSEETEESGDEKEVAQRGYAERRQLKEKVTKGLADRPEYIPQSAEELEEAGMDPALAGIEALRQEVRRDQIINELTELNASVNTDANGVLREFPVYDPNSKDYDEKFAKDVEQLYRKYANFEMDPTGSYITRADIPLGEFFRFAAQSRGTGSQQAEIQGQKAAEKMLAATDEPSSAPETTTKSGSDSGEDDLWLAGLRGEKGTYAAEK